MKAKYDGTWVWIPRGRTESMLLLEWLAENGHTLGKMTVIVYDSDPNDEENEDSLFFKLYFEFPHKGLLENLIKYINENN